MSVFHSAAESCRGLGCVDTKRVGVAAGSRSVLLGPLFVSLSAKRSQGVGSYQRDPSSCISVALCASVLAWMQNINQPSQLHLFIHQHRPQQSQRLRSLSSFSLAHIWREGQVKGNELLADLRERLYKVWMEYRQLTVSIHRESWAHILKDTQLNSITDLRARETPAVEDHWCSSSMNWLWKVTALS